MSNSSNKTKNRAKLPHYIQVLTESDVEELLKSDREIIKQFARWVSEPSKVVALEAQITKLSQENLRLRTIMFAAHQEITEFWDAHCDKDGYGPQSLVRHLKEGTGFYPGYVDDVINPKSEAVVKETPKTQIPGLIGITEEQLENGGMSFHFDIEDDKVDDFFAAFGLKTGDDEGFERVVINAIQMMIEKHESEKGQQVSQVEHPAHYRSESGFEAIDVIEAWNLGFNLGNTLKYISRAGLKDKARTCEDLEKAKWYLEREIKRIKEQK